MISESNEYRRTSIGPNPRTEVFIEFFQDELSLHVPFSVPVRMS